MVPFKKKIKPGIHLFRENDRSRELYIIQSGSVKVYRTAGGKEIELAVLEKGSVLGEMALIDGKPRSASAKTILECEVIIIDADTFHETIKGIPTWFMSIVRMTSQKIRQANRRLQNISNTQQEAPVIITLHLYFQRFDRDNNGLDIKQTQHHLIQLLGVTYQSVIRALDFLHTNKFIEFNDDTLHVLDIERYGEYCEYLRFLLRKQFAGMEEPSKNILTLSRVLIGKYPKILNQDGSTTTVEGDLFYHFLKSNDLHEHYEELIDSLTEEGLCTTVRNTRGNPQRPLGDTKLKLNHTGWKRVYLYGKYYQLSPKQ
jgi:CRP/FNR family transcriptional regulator, cyclic AMP receptor protein